MKKIYILLLAALLLIYTVLIIPIEFNHKYEGVKFRLGEEGIVKKVVLEFQGKIYRNWKLQKIYNGNIKINDYSFPTDKSENSTIKVYLNHRDWQIVTDRYLSDDKFQVDTLGELFISNDKEKVTLTIWDNNGWDNEDGLMIASPADTRIEGLIISNDLMKKVLTKQLE